jgi:nucleoid-associated protein YgaU
MGLFDFMKDKGKKVAKTADAPTAQEIQSEVARALGGRITDLGVYFSGGKATLQGEAEDYAAKQKAVLVAGNIAGVQQVDDNLTVARADEPEPTARFYTIEKGDSLSKIAQSEYGDAGKWRALFEANREVIEDPDQIYPGQQIRLPAEV